MTEKKEGGKNLAELEGILAPKYVENLKKRARIREKRVRKVEITYKATLTTEEVRRCPFLAGLAELPPDPETEAAQHELEGLVKELLKHRILTQRERNALRLRFGIGCREHTPVAAARELGISAGNVRSAIKSAVRKLQRHGKCACLKQFHK